MISISKALRAQRGKRCDPDSLRPHDTRDDPLVTGSKDETAAGSRILGERSLQIREMIEVFTNFPIKSCRILETNTRPGS